MRSEHRIVDLNAYIENIQCEIKNTGENKQLEISFRNVSQDVITAIRLKCVCYDSFDDKIQFGTEDFLEVKKASLNIKTTKKASFVVDVEPSDLKKVEIEVLQIVYINGEKVAPKEAHNIEYDVDILSSVWSVNDHSESDMLSYMKEKNDKAVCLPKEHPDGWICSCSRLNKNGINRCVSCGYGKNNNFEYLQEEKIKHELEERLIQKKNAEEKRKAELKAAEEKAEKKKKQITTAVVGAIVLVVIIGILSTVIHNIKYGLSDEEKAQYLTAQNNYEKIETFVSGVSHDYWNLARENYFDDDFENTENRLSDAEKNADYLYLRGLELASSLLYETIKSQYPDKYHEAYNHLISLKKGDIYNDYQVTETMYVKNYSASNMMDKREGIDNAIENMEVYMSNETLNPSKVKLVNADMPEAEYSKVYGINLGVLFYDDGNIRYIGEVKDGKASGYGIAWYPSENDNRTCCDGEFVDGLFNSGEAYDTDGNSITASELKDILFEGEFVMVQGLSNSKTSEQVAQQTKNDEERDMAKACAAVETYLNDLDKKQSSITNITWINIPDVVGNYYYFSCTVEYSDLKRKGTVTVKKNSDGTFKATGLEFND